MVDGNEPYGPMKSQLAFLEHFFVKKEFENTYRNILYMELKSQRTIPDLDHPSILICCDSAIALLVFRIL